LGFVDVVGVDGVEDGADDEVLVSGLDVDDFVVGGVEFVSLEDVEGVTGLVESGFDDMLIV
jgi:hypothetical protein